MKKKQNTYARSEHLLSPLGRSAFYPDFSQQFEDIINETHMIEFLTPVYVPLKFRFYFEFCTFYVHNFYVLFMYYFMYYFMYFLCNFLCTFEYRTISKITRRTGIIRNK